jgi:histidine phosphotransferase ChpT
MSSRDLNSLLGSRICHDLISPLGAIGNGIELLALSGINAAPEIALISESVENANVRIRFFRIAYGAAGETETVPAQECRSLLLDLSRGNRLRYRWLLEDEKPRAQVKLAFLLIQCLETAMPFGGLIDVIHDGGRWTLTGTADRTKVDEDLWALLVDTGSDAKVTAANVHFALVAPAAAHAGCRVSSNLADGEIRISF